MKRFSRIMSVLLVLIMMISFVPSTLMLTAETAGDIAALTSDQVDKAIAQGYEFMNESPFKFADKKINRCGAFAFRCYKDGADVNIYLGKNGTGPGSFYYAKSMYDYMNAQGLIHLDPNNNAPKGALVFFTGSTAEYGHIGISLGNGNYIHAKSTKDGIVVSELSSTKGYLGWSRPIEYDIQFCTHQYLYDICSKCGAVKEYTIASCSGDYAVSVNNAVKQKTAYPVSDPSVGPIAMAKNEVVAVIGQLTANGLNWYKLSDGYFIAQSAVRKVEIPSNISISITKYPSGNFEKGTPYGINGTVSSSYKITSLTHYIQDTATGKNVRAVTKSTNSTSVAVNPNGGASLSFATLPVGSYKYWLVATDSQGTAVSSSKYAFNVVSSSTPDCAKPYVDSVSLYPGGKTIVIKSTTAGASISYTVNGIGGSGVSPVSIAVSEYTYITAYSSKAGYNKSGTLSYYINVDELAAPAISTEVTAYGTRVSLSANAGDNAAIYYSTGGGDVKYSEPFMMSASGTVSAYAACDGWISSDKSTMAITVAPPAAPSVSLYGATSSIVAQGRTASVQWNAVAGAGGYAARLYKDGVCLNTKETTGRIASLTLDEAGSYQITVEAYNFIGGRSGESAPVGFTSKAPSTVTFVDYDGTVLSAQTVDYGSSAIRPVAPQRRGHSFNGWSGSYGNVTADITLTAEYTVNLYAVKFCHLDINGNLTTISTKTVIFDQAVDTTAAKASVYLPVGHEFVGWRVEKADEGSGRDYTHVDSDMALVAVTKWANESLPVEITNLYAERDDNATGYHVSFLYSNSESAATNDAEKAKIIVALKSSEDKLLALTTETVNINANTQRLAFGSASDGNPVNGTRDAVYVSYNGSFLVNRIEVTVVRVDGNDRTGGALSELRSASPNMAKRWTEWSTTAPPSGAESQSKTQYQYRDRSKKYTTSAGSSLSGWTRYDTTYVWGGWINNGTTMVTATDNRQVSTQSVAATYKTQYSYGGYKGVKSGSTTKTHFCINAAKSVYPSYSWTWVQSDWSDSPAPFTSWTKAQTCACGNCLGYVTGYYQCSSPNLKLYNVYTRQVEVTPAYTTYQYRDKIFTYYYWKWDSYGAWSSWSDTACSASDYRQIQTQTQYRWVTNSTAQQPEDTSGILKTLSGAVATDQATDLSGLKATVMVYKETNSDPTEAQLEYVGQVTLGAGNSYSLSFKTKEEPSDSTGDFLVTVAVEGMSNLINLTGETIAAPRETFTVKYCDASGEPLSTQTVLEGGTALAPEPPVVAGHTFSKWKETSSEEGAPTVDWSGTIIDVSRNMEPYAVYTPDVCVVAFVDWVNNTLVLDDSFRYGDPLAAKETPSAEGYDFVKWDAVTEGENTLVTENMIVTAVYAPKTFTVSFYDQTGENVIDAQQVEYGKAAELPDGLVVEGMKFLGWDTDAEWWNVTSDLNVYPLMTFEETCVEPDTSVESGVYTLPQMLELTVNGNSAVYYRIKLIEEEVVAPSGVSPSGEAEDPTEEGWLLYEGPVELSRSCTVEAFTVDEGKNPSDIVFVDFYYDEYFAAPEDYGEIVEIGTYEVLAQAGKTVTLEVSIEQNPGLLGYMFIVEADRSVFYMDYDAETGFNCTAGAASENGTMLCGLYEDAGWQVMWYGVEPTENDGLLFTIVLNVGEEAGTGTYPVTVSYSAANTISGEFYETEVSGVSVKATAEGALALGDITGDTYITNADVVFLARYLVDLEVMSDDQRQAADVTKDGNVTIADVVKLARSLVGLDTL